MDIFDISQLSENNPWWVDKRSICFDKHVKDLDKLKYQWKPGIKHYINLQNDVIYSLRGPRQVGKTTLIKTLIKELLIERDVKAENVFYWSFENNDSKELHKIIDTYLKWRVSSNDRKYLFLDEICSVKNWPKEIIHFKNKGRLEKSSVIVTGSHSMDLKSSTERMPGRRGGQDEEALDKILIPMKFSEYVNLLFPQIKNKLFELELVKGDHKKEKIFNMFEGKIDKTIEDLLPYKSQLDSLLENYLITGGIPPVINEFKKKEKVTTRIFNIYIQAMIGDLKKYGYKELFFKQIVREMFKVLSNPVSWNNFTKHTDVKSHNTVQEYITAMEELFIASISYRCSIHDKRIHSFMKKMYFQDPFIFHALHGWSNGKADYFRNTKENILNTEMKSKLVESVVYNHLCRFSFNLHPRDLFDPKDHICYFEDSSKREVDFVVISDDGYFPFESKYQASVNKQDFFPFKSFGKGVMVTKDDIGLYRNYVKIPLSIFLMLI